MAALPRRILLLAAIAALAVYTGFKIREILRARAGGAATISSRMKEFGTVVEQRLRPNFRRANVAWPPARVVYVGLKEEQRLEVYVAGKGGDLRFLRAYPVKAASGALGPKLKEGDCQVPEGLYGVEYLNPNSLYHLSMKIGYPNAFDRARGKEDGRKRLGGDIMIHGDAVSAGCLAMGDEAAEDLFILAALAGVRNVSVILSPVDFRVRGLPPEAAKTLPKWTETLYPQIREALGKLPGH